MGLGNLIKRFNRWLAPAAATQGATATTPQPTAVGTQVVAEDIDEAEREELTPEERKPS